MTNTRWYTITHHSDAYKKHKQTHNTYTRWTIYTYTRTYQYTYIYVHIHTNVHTNVRIHKLTHKNAHIHSMMYTNTRQHTYKLACLRYHKIIKTVFKRAYFWKLIKLWGAKHVRANTEWIHTQPYNYTNAQTHRWINTQTQKNNETNTHSQQWHTNVYSQAKTHGRTRVVSYTHGYKQTHAYIQT